MAVCLGRSSFHKAFEACCKSSLSFFCSHGDNLPKLWVFLPHLSEKRDIINLPIPVGYNPGLCLGEKCQMAYLQLPVPGNQEDRNAPDFLKSKIRVNIFSPIWKLQQDRVPFFDP